MMQKPLNGLAVGFMAEFSGQLEDSGGAESGHANPPAAAVNFGVAVFVGGPFWGKKGSFLRVLNGFGLGHQLTIRVGLGFFWIH